MAEILVGDLPNADALPAINLPTLRNDQQEVPVAETLEIEINPRAQPPVDESTATEAAELVPRTSAEPDDNNWLVENYADKADLRAQIGGPAGQSLQDDGINAANIVDSNAFVGASNVFESMVAPYKAAAEAIGDVSWRDVWEASEEAGNAIVDGVMGAAQGVIDVSGELADVAEDQLGPLSFAGYEGLVWDKKGLRLVDVMPDDVQNFTIPKFWTEPETPVGIIGSGIVQFVTAMAATSMGTLGTIPYKAGRFMAYGAVADSLFDPEDGNFSTMLKDLGVEPNAVLDYLGTPVGKDAEAAERLAQRLKNALEGGLIGLPFDLAPLLFKGFKELKKSAPMLAKAIAHLESKTELPSQAQPGDLDAAVPGPGNLGPEQLPLVPDYPRQTAEDLPGTPVATLPQMATDLDEMGFYSAALRFAEELPQEKGTPAQMKKALLSGAGVREEELMWTGLDDLFAARAAQGKKGQVTKQEIIDHLRANRVVIRETEGLSINTVDNDMQWDEDTLPNIWTSEVLNDPQQVDDLADALLSDMPATLSSYPNAFAEPFIKAVARSIEDMVDERRAPNEPRDSGVIAAINEELEKDVRAVVGYHQNSATQEIDRFARSLAEYAAETEELPLDTLNALSRITGISTEELDVYDGALRYLEDSDDAREITQNLAQRNYDDDPTYRYTDDSNHGYEITGNDEQGYYVNYEGSAVNDTGDSSPLNTLGEAQQAAMEHATDNGLAETISRGESEAQYANYTMPGGENYRELLLQFNESPGGAYRGGHFSDGFVPGGLANRTMRGAGAGRGDMAVENLTDDDTEAMEGVLAHVRLKDRFIGDEKVLSIEEIQSDLHKKTRARDASGKYSYRSPAYRTADVISGKAMQDVTQDMARILVLPMSRWDETSISNEALAPLGINLESSAAAGLRVLTANGQPIKKLLLEEKTALSQSKIAELRQQDGTVYEITPEGRSNMDGVERLYAAVDAAKGKPQKQEEPLVGFIREYNRLNDLRLEVMRAEGGRTPDAPFKTMDERGWPQLAMRRIMRYAVENDYDRIAWSPGSIQHERYGAPTKLYDKTIPKILDKIIKKFDPAMKIDEDQAMDYGMYPMDTHDGERFFIPSVKLTPKMRSSIKRLGQAIMALPPVALAAQTVTSEQPAATPTQ